VYVCYDCDLSSLHIPISIQGLHVNAIAEKTNIDGMKLGIESSTYINYVSCSRSFVGRVMHYLATHHIYREIEPEVFTNN
jgi:hypothetical protein